MQIFAVHRDPAAAAQALGDKHVVKMVLESTQLLSAVASLAGHATRYRPTHINHPCTRWVGERGGHWHWLMAHARALAAEYEFRYQRRHACLDVIGELAMIDVADDRAHMPVCFTTRSLDKAYWSLSDVYAHRVSYLREKSHLLIYRRGRAAPNWVVENDPRAGDGL